MRRVLAALGLLALCAAVQAAPYPNAQLRIVVGASPGGTVDSMARLLAEGLSARLRQSVIVENRPGANGAIAAETVAKARPDGYTLLLGTSGLTTLPLLQKSLPYDLDRDLAMVAITGFTPFLLFSGAASPASSVPELIAYARDNPQRLSVAVGDGTTLLASEFFKAATGISVLTVNYKSGSQMVTDVAGGSVDYGFLGATAVAPLAKSGRLRMLAVASEQRLDVAPDVPTLPELGVQSYFLQPWTGILAPAGTDPGVVQTLERALAETAGSEAFRAKVAEMGSVPRFLGAREAGAYVAEEQAALAQAAANAGIQPAD